jgi:hypothetical protein
MQRWDAYRGSVTSPVPALNDPLAHGVSIVAAAGVQFGMN